MGRYTSVERDRAAHTRLEQAALRLRLAAAALGVTLLLLATPADRTAAAFVLLAYLLVAVGLRAAAGGGQARVRPATVEVLGAGADILFAAALSLVLPGAPAWPLYAFAVGGAALRRGPLGAAAATAAAVVAYDVVLISRGADARAVDLWPVQVLLALGLIAAELVWVSVRAERDRAAARAFSLAQRDCAAAGDEQTLLERLADHAVRGFGARSASIVRERDGAPPIVAARGTAPEGDPGVVEVRLAGDTVVRASFAPADAADGLATLGDLAADVAPLLQAARERETQRRERDVERGVLAALTRLERERTVAGVLAEAAFTAGALIGPAAVLRLADGAVLAGDLAPERAASIGREAVPPRLVRVARTAERPPGTAAVVSLGPGQALVAIGREREASEHDVASLAVLSEVAAAVAARIAQQDALSATAAELRGRNEELAGELRERDDAVASAVHELRNPLASVRAYGQLMSRHLGAVQRQVLQLDSLIEDLLHAPAGASPRPLALEPVDLAREAGEAAGRLRVAAPDREVRVVADRREAPFTVLLDPIRFAQVLDNVLGNAAKFSPREAAIEVRVERRPDDIAIAVTDRGDGILTEDLERIFERYVRGSGRSAAVPGAGIGLAVARELVAAHGGRIWAESPGPGQGSTFTIALPAAVAAAANGAVEGVPAR